MEFDLENEVVILCAQGMEMEGRANHEEAGRVFLYAWSVAKDDFERFIAAHYVARHQKNTADKLKWDERALALALTINNDMAEQALPSLYLNIAKCHENLKDFANAKIHYELARSFISRLPGDGYGNMIKTGILNGLERLKK